MPQKTRETPMMEQYLEYKKQYPDAFLLYRVGDFYEMFYDDAVKGSQILELTLTARNKKAGENIPMCGVPHRAIEGYIDTLVDKGYKVAVCDQLENPADAEGKMVKRGVTRVVTPGTIMDKSDQSKDNNYITAITSRKNTFGLAYADLSTGEVKVTTVENQLDLTNELQNLDTKETVVSGSFPQKYLERLRKYGILISKLDELEDNYSFDFSQVQSDDEVSTVKLLISYLIKTQMRSLDHLKAAQSYETSSYLLMDHSAQSNLELFKNIRTNKKSGTLLWLLDETKTAMGSRLLKQWLARPLISVEKLKRRQHFVQVFLDNYFQRSSFQDYLTKVYDLERLAGRVAYGTVNGRDLIQLKTSLEQIPEIKSILLDIGDDELTHFVEQIDEVADIRDLIEKAIVEEAPISVTGGGLIKEGYNDQLDKYLDASKNGKQWLASLKAKEQEMTGINNLKIGYNKVFGYYIEVSRANIDKVPEDRYQRKQTLVNAERYITPELKDKESLILEAEEKSKSLEYHLFDEIRKQIKDQIRRIQGLANIVSQLDVLQSFAVISEEYHYVAPEFIKEHELQITNGRHPVVEKVLSNNSYIPNDVNFDDKTDILLITGPNMSGKSTYMRQMALIVIMAQIGCFVPADSAKMPIFDHIFTRIGAADDLISGDSTFMVEMREANDALKNATPNSLIIFDEIGRGTATYDGMALAQAIIEYIDRHVKAMTLFSTHYHELTELEAQLPGLRNVHVDASEENGDLVFLHKVLPGPADKSYGIHVAKLAGLPTDVLNRASKILSSLEETSVHTTTSDSIKEPTVLTTEKEPVQATAVQSKEETAEPEVNDDTQLSLFPETPKQTKKLSTKETQVIKEIGDQDLMGITPIEAINLLYKWQKKLK
ncbi:DNA mismatch repair protein MutS [Companilactobacillus mindensis DSM 14500]|uniref:DNA mismatch repair protein MutS n=1 Tax=Companilactobacillus mindensis DSM 14500 TaxID=1423770 RepID=A0A0R1QPA4_9LACO|nr:DNA mismatch repair protein MutS [Companilactobacillus mindensis]KRL42939.1 DNA mismatch repair protein MutS [Companilactobacillus mindensis DSM 14500]GEO79496.1 DNA mismatch repair protein MutS [Companilactobacillus mindensis]